MRFLEKLSDVLNSCETWSFDLEFDVIGTEQIVAFLRYFDGVL